MSVFNAIQAAVFTALDGAVTIDANAVPVYDHVPQATAYPYAVIGDDPADEWDTKTTCGLRTTATVRVFTRELGRKQCKAILGQIYTALHQADLTIDGQQAVWCYFQFMETFLNDDGLTYGGVIRFEIATTEQ